MVCCAGSASWTTGLAAAETLELIQQILKAEMDVLVVAKATLQELWWDLHEVV